MGISERKTEAADSWACEIDDLVPCERCPVYDEVCDHCGETGWVPFDCV